MAKKAKKAAAPATGKKADKKAILKASKKALKTKKKVAAIQKRIDRLQKRIDRMTDKKVKLEKKRDLVGGSSKK